MQQNANKEILGIEYDELSEEWIEKDVNTSPHQQIMTLDSTATTRHIGDVDEYEDGTTKKTSMAVTTPKWMKAYNNNGHQVKVETMNYLFRSPDAEELKRNTFASKNYETDQEEGDTDQHENSGSKLKVFGKHDTYTNGKLEGLLDVLGTTTTNSAMTTTQRFQHTLKSIPSEPSIPSHRKRRSYLSGNTYTSSEGYWTNNSERQWNSADRKDITTQDFMDNADTIMEKLMAIAPSNIQSLDGENDDQEDDGRSSSRFNYEESIAASGHVEYEEDVDISAPVQGDEEDGEDYDEEDDELDDPRYEDYESQSPIAKSNARLSSVIVHSSNMKNAPQSTFVSPPLLPQPAGSHKFQRHPQSPKKPLNIGIIKQEDVKDIIPPTIGSMNYDSEKNIWLRNQPSGNAENQMRDLLPEEDPFQGIDDLSDTGRGSRTSRYSRQISTNQRSEFSGRGTLAEPYSTLQSYHIGIKGAVNPPYHGLRTNYTSTSDVRLVSNDRDYFTGNSYKDNKENINGSLHSFNFDKLNGKLEKLGSGNPVDRFPNLQTPGPISESLSKYAIDAEPSPYTKQNPQIGRLKPGYEPKATPSISHPSNHNTPNSKTRVSNNRTSIVSQSQYSIPQKLEDIKNCFVETPKASLKSKVSFTFPPRSDPIAVPDNKNTKEEEVFEKQEISPSISELVSVINSVYSTELVWDNLTTLNLNNQGLQSVDSLATFCSSVKNLSLSHNKLTVLNGLPNSVRRLDVSFNNLSKLTTYPQAVQYLNISGNSEITNFGGLAGLSGLRELLADFCGISGWEGISEIIDGLQKLSLKNNRFDGTVDVESFGVGEMCELKTLELSENKIIDIKGLEKLDNLKVLEIGKLSPAFLY